MAPEAGLDPGAGTAQDARKRLRPDIQGLRALAVILILLFHARTPLHGGFIGVDVFFVISGFVITAMLMREHARNGRIRLRSFTQRRFLRLMPALALAASVTIVISIFLQSPFGAQQVTAQTAAGAMLFSANVVIAATTGNYFDAPAAANPLLNTWSLSVEEQFYLLFPSVIVACLVLARRRRWAPRIVVLAVVAAIGLASLILALRLAGDDLGWPATALVGYYGMVTRAWEFAIGAVIALVATRLARMPRLAAEVLAATGLVLVLLSAILLDESSPYPGATTLWPVLGTGAIIAAGCAHRTLASRTLSVRPMVFVGGISYAWYLWHWPLITFAFIIGPARIILAPTAALLLSFIIAWASTRYLETPIRYATGWSGRRLAALVTACLVIPLGLAALLWWGASSTWWRPWPVATSYQDSASAKRGCHDTAVGLEQCRWPVPDATGTVLLLGDSQALSLSDGLIEAAGDLGLDVEVSSYSQCPFIAAGRTAYDYDNSGCPGWQADALDYALATRPQVVVIANRPYAFGMTENVDLLDAAGAVASGPASAQAWSDALGSVVTRLRQAGIAVVLAEPIPEPRYEVAPSGLIHLGRERASTADAVAWRAPALALDQAVAVANPGTVIYDPLPALCDQGSCPDVADGAFLYADPRHLSVAGSKRLAPGLRELLAGIPLRRDRQ